MKKLWTDVICALEGKTLVTAESCTGGGIGSALTSVPGSSAVYKGGVICYTNWVKEHILGVAHPLLEQYGAVSLPVAEAMARGAANALKADIAVSVTSLAGPDGDEFGNPVGTVFIGCHSPWREAAREYHFSGDRAAVREQAVTAALELVLEILSDEKKGE
jgi:PncC family amidohydrolase